jgi:hypothetical protein
MQCTDVKQTDQISDLSDGHKVALGHVNARLECLHQKTGQRTVVKNSLHNSL